MKYFKYLIKSHLKRGMCLLSIFLSLILFIILGGWHYRLHIIPVNFPLASIS